MDRDIKTTLYNILNLISIAGDYGFNDDVLLDSFREMIGKQLLDEEIEGYATLILECAEYGEEDYEEIKERLYKFKKEYYEEDK